MITYCLFTREENGFVVIFTWYGVLAFRVNVTASRPVAFDKINDPGSIIIPGTLFGFNGAYTFEDTLRQGEGYWLRAFSAGQVAISCVASLQGFRKSLAPPVALERFPELHISDAVGANQTLYFNVELDNPKQKLSYSLPPLMPGIFDARFAGDYRILESDEGIIHIQSSHYPVTITASNLPEIADYEYMIQEIVSGKAITHHALREGESIEIGNPKVNNLRLTKEDLIPIKFNVAQNYPNPFNPITEIRFVLPSKSPVEINIYNTLGQKVKTLISRQQEAGYHSVTWDATNALGQKVGSGVYFYSVTAGEHRVVRKMLLVR